MEDLDLIFNNLSFNDSISLNKLAIMAGAKLVSWPKGDYFVNINNQSQLDGYMEII
jgi:hypothetical protein